MNELNLSISTGKESNKVVLTAAFTTQEEAVKFHAAIAELCEKADGKKDSTFTLGTKLLGWSK